MTEAQLILVEMGKGTTILARLARMYVDDPVLAEQFLREQYDQTHTNMAQCVQAFGQEIVDRMIAHCGKTK